jgi:hypothetical protein
VLKSIGDGSGAAWAVPPRPRVSIYKERPQMTVVRSNRISPRMSTSAVSAPGVVFISTERNRAGTCAQNSSEAYVELSVRRDVISIT